MRVTYDPDADAAYVYLTDEELMPGRQSVPCDPPAGQQAIVVLDWKDGKIVGLEVLDASARLHADLLAQAVRPGEGSRTEHTQGPDDFETTGVSVDIASAATPEEFYSAFFAATAGVVPDYGGRNLDALLDDLGDLAEPVTIALRGADRAAHLLGDWFERLLGTFARAIERSEGQLTFVLQAADDG